MARVPKLVVVTLNLLHGSPIPGARHARESLEERLEWTARRLAEVQADVVLLQEASVGASHPNTAQTLAARLGMEWLYARANPAWPLRLGGVPERLLPRLRFEEGPAILSRLPVLGRRVHRLSSPLAVFDHRVALEAVLAGPAGAFSAFSVHLTAFSRSGRIAQIGALVRAVEQSAHLHPSIVGGDFNAEEHSHEIRLLTQALGWTDSFRHVHPDAAGHTWGQALAAATATAGQRIDFLFSTPAGEERWRPSHARLILDTAFPASDGGVLWASDHHGVLAEFEPSGSIRGSAGFGVAGNPAGTGRIGEPRGCEASAGLGDAAGSGATARVADPTGVALALDLPLGWRLPPPHRERVRALLAAAVGRPAAGDWAMLPEQVRSRQPERVRAVLGYGSWFTADLRKPTSFPDLFLVVDDYTRFHERRSHAWMNRVLPPNVYFLWDESGERRVLRGKLNVLSMADLERECGARLRDVYNAGRLTKLVWIAWAADSTTRAWVIERLIEANQTMTALVLGLLPDDFTPERFSLELLAASYRAEARLEGWERVRALHAAHARIYAELHDELLEGFAEATGLLGREGGLWRKRLRPGWGELSTVAHRLLRRSRWRGYLRWLRIIWTERHLADLAANEAERKAGVRIRLTPRLRRHPLLLGLPEYLRVLRERDTRERIGRLRRIARLDRRP